MPIDPKVVSEIAERIKKASALCHESLFPVKTHEGLGMIQVYGKLVGNFMGASYKVLAPIWKHFPELLPAEMRTPYVKLEPGLSVESQRAIQEFLREAQAALEFAKAASPDDADEAIRFNEGIAEIEECAKAIDEFLRHPRSRE